MDDAFAAGGTPKEQEIRRNMAEWNREAVTKAEQELIRRVLLLLPSKPAPSPTDFMGTPL